MKTIDDDIYDYDADIDTATTIDEDEDDCSVIEVPRPLLIIN